MIACHASVANGGDWLGVRERYSSVVGLAGFMGPEAAAGGDRSLGGVTLPGSGLTTGVKGRTRSEPGVSTC